MIYKTKADVGKLIQQAIRGRSELDSTAGPRGLDKVTKYAWGNNLVHNSYTWMFAIEHSAEHYAACGVLPREQHGAAGLAALMQQ